MKTKITAVELAQLAIPLLEKHNGNHDLAIKEATQLLAECEAISAYDIWRNTPKPPKDSLTFKELLRYLMPQVDKEDERLPRFKRWVAETPVAGGMLGKDAAEKELASLSSKTFNESMCWFLYQTFHHWQQQDISKTRSKAAKGRKLTA